MKFDISPALVKLIDKYQELDVFMKIVTILLFLTPTVYWGSKAYRNFADPIVITKIDTVFVPIEKAKNQNTGINFGQSKVGDTYN